ncbi:MAG: DNA-protecting protein DprA [Bacteroidetes bacterium]|nr:MAG: DNA-protecting protein DprA [Bacteroidota bacterium]
MSTEQNTPPAGENTSGSTAAALRYAIAMTHISGVGPKLARQLRAYYGDYSTVFSQTARELQNVPGIGEQTARAIASATGALEAAEREIAFCQKSGLLMLQTTDELYPPLLRDLPDAPLVLFYRGNPEPLKLGKRSISIVGTRRATSYGREMVARIVQELHQQGQRLCIISGLAHGIDGEAHRAALQHGIPTIGVMAHGFRHFYPASHRDMAARMLENGGLITEFPSTRKPDPRTFLQRNRIIAGMAAATIIAESAVKGGAMVTAQNAEEMLRPLFAFPGTVGREMSTGCNDLIKRRKATLLETAEDLINGMGWTPARQRAMEASLFYRPTEDEQRIIDAIRTAGSIALDELSRTLGTPIGQLNATLFNLEMQGVVRQLPGKVFELPI